MPSELSTLPVLRQSSVRAVLDVILRDGPISRAEIARSTGLSKQTISDVMRDLEQDGWVQECGQVQGALGRSALNYEIRARSAFALAIDLGGTKLHVGLADLSGELVAETEERTDPRGGVRVVEQIGRLTARLAAEAGVHAGTIRCGVMGCPGVVDRTTGGITAAPNVPGFDRIDVGEALRRELGFGLSIENDVNLAAVGERWRGANRDIATFAFIAIGTGIGLGLVADGRLVRGTRGAAGEIANLPIGGDPFDARTHRLGTLETAVGSAAIAERYAGHGGDAASVREIFAALESGDATAAVTIDEVARIVALAVLSVSCLLDPEIVVFGGSIGSRPELRARIDRHLARCMAEPVPTAISTLGSRATLIGAVGLSLDHLRSGLFGLTPRLHGGFSAGEAVAA